MKNKKMLLMASAVFFIALFGAGTFFYKKNKMQKQGFMASENAELLVKKYSPSMGPDDAQVYLVEFLDPECESCRQFYPHVKNLMKEFEGKIKLVIRYAPFHHNSVFAIKTLEAARKQGKYWEALETLFNFQPKWGSHHNPQPQLIWDYLPIVGVDVAKAKEDIKDASVDKMIEQEMMDVKKLGIRGTPAFFINGKPLQKFGLQYLKEAIQAEL
jgi:protein-disulfide isomerase